MPAAAATAVMWISPRQLSFTPTSGPDVPRPGRPGDQRRFHVNFNFDSLNTDQIAVGGVLATANAAPSNQINLNLNDQGTMANGLTLFTFQQRRDDSRRPFADRSGRL